MNRVNQIFQTALSQRSSCPFVRGGVYKIQEASDKLHRSSENISRLMLYQQTKIGSKCFIRCCWNDRASWLKEALLDTAWRLGYEMAPAIGALEQDGVHPSNIAAIDSWAKVRTPMLLNRIHEIYKEIKTSIRREYTAWDQGYSLIQGEIDRTVNFGDEIIRAASKPLLCKR